MISKLWHHICEMFVRSQWHMFITSLWSHSVVIVWCHRYTRWPHHYEVTVLSHCDVTDTWIWPHHNEVTERCSPCDVIMMSLWYRNYDIIFMSCLWGHSDTSWPHHHKVIALSQYDVTDTQDDHITMRSQCCHRMMLTLWCPVDITMISLLCHHMCEFCVMSLWYWRDIMCWLSMNPFDGELGLTHLFNIGTGEAASDNTEILFFTIKKIHIRMHWKAKPNWDENTSTKSAHICIQSR